MSPLLHIIENIFTFNKSQQYQHKSFQLKIFIIAIANFFIIIAVTSTADIERPKK